MHFLAAAYLFVFAVYRLQASAAVISSHSSLKIISPNVGGVGLPIGVVPEFETFFYLLRSKATKPHLVRDLKELDSRSSTRIQSM
jgi:hypothetical protein